MTEAHTQRKHARLAPSAAHRWMHCPGSVRMSEGIESTSSVFAAEGTAAHELCAVCLELDASPYDYAGKWVDIKEGEIVDTPVDTNDTLRFFEIDEEMCDAVDMYVEHVRSLMRDGGNGPETDAGYLEVEQKLDMTHLHPEIFGTGDATVFHAGAKHLHVIDFKYGKGVAVDATENPQLLLYAAGAARRHHNAGITGLTMHIVQPRAEHRDGPIRAYDIDLLDLFEFENDLAAAAAETDKPDAPLHAGEWCRFCPALAICPEARRNTLEQAADDFGAIDLEALPAPEAMSDEHVGRILRNADSLGNWVKAVQMLGHDRACNGKMPAGFKLVQKRAIRKWRDETDAADALYAMGAGESDILTEPKLKSPAQLEKFFPGKNKDQRQKAMADLVVKQSSGVNLVPEGDPRPAVNIGAGADFEQVET